MSRHLIIVLFICLISVTSNLTPALAKRLALVIGNDKYIHLDKRAQLERAVNDARSVGKAFSDLGFQVIEGYNLGRTQINLKIAQLVNRIEKGDEVAFFYAGHGVSIEGQNYLIPSDTRKVASGKKKLLKEESVRVGSVIDRFKSKGSRVNLVILDACRNNPFKNRTRSGRKRSIGGRVGLSKVKDPGEGTMIIFSAGEGQLALDSLTFTKDTHQNSVFTRSLVPLLKVRGLEIKSLANKIRREVYLLAKKDNHKQVPAAYNEIISDYYLAGRSITAEQTEQSSKTTDDALDIASLGTSNTETKGDLNQSNTRDSDDFIREVFEAPIENEDDHSLTPHNKKHHDIPHHRKKTDRIKFFFKPLQNEYIKGQEVNFVVKSSKPCYLTLVNIPETGNTTVIFPNGYNQNNRIEAHTKYEIPGSLIKNFRLRFSHSGIERVLAICNATRPDPKGIIHKFHESPYTVVPKHILANIDKKKISRQIQVIADVKKSDVEARRENLPALLKNNQGKDIEVRALVILEVSEY